MRLAFLILGLAACLAGGQTQGQVLTNQSVAEMVKAGVAADLIIDTLYRSDCSFRLDPANLIWLKNAGVPDEIVRVMASRAVGLPTPGSKPAAPASPVPAPPPQSSYAPEPPVERVTNVGAETEDWDFGLGTVALQFAGGLSAGTDRPVRTVAPAVNGGINVGLNRYVSLIGDYAWHPLGAADFVSCSGGVCAVVPVKVRAHEMTGGVKVSIPTSSRFTPFFTGSAGVFRASAGASVLGIGISASDSAFMGGGGAGFRLNLTRRLALDYDVRLFTGQYNLFYGRTTLGLLVRLN